MSYNLQSKRCQICGKRVEGGTEEASQCHFDGMRLTRPVFGMDEFIWVCTWVNDAQGKLARSDCFQAAEKQGYVVHHGMRVLR